MAMRTRTLGLVARRLAQAVPLLAIVLFVVFALVRLAPGNPARTQLGLRATPARVASLDHELGLDKPLLSGYLDYAWHALQGNLGNSVRAQVPVTTLIANRVGVTLWLLICSVLVSLAIAVPLAFVSARRAEGRSDHAIRAISVLGLSIPTFWLGLMLVSFVALDSGWFPVSGFGSGFFGHLHAIALPAITLAVAITPIQIRALRIALISVLDSDFIAALRAVGVKERRVMLRHALPNAVLSSLSLLAAQVGVLLFAEVIVENTFALPGLGQAMLQGVAQRDYPVVQGLTLLAVAIVIAINLLVDVLYVTLDPRIELG
jgi:peptide/nickel transport system permease protein